MGHNQVKKTVLQIINKLDMILKKEKVQDSQLIYTKNQLIKMANDPNVKYKTFMSHVNKYLKMGQSIIKQQRKQLNAKINHAKNQKVKKEDWNSIVYYIQHSNALVIVFGLISMIRILFMSRFIIRMTASIVNSIANKLFKFAIKLLYKVENAMSLDELKEVVKQSKYRMNVVQKYVKNIAAKR